MEQWFQIDDPTRYRKLLFSAAVDDGAVVYLNGKRMRTWNAPPEAAHNAVAMIGLYTGRVLANSRDGTLTPGLLPWGGNVSGIIDPRLLRNGKNVLAIQGFNKSITDNDFSLIPVLEAERRADSDEERKLLDEFRQAASGHDAGVRTTYLESRLLQRQGKHNEAAAKFLELGEKELAQHRTALHLIESLRRSGRIDEAWRRVTELLSADAWSNQELVELWIRICLVNRGLTPGSMLSEIPSAESTSESARGEKAVSFVEDLRYALRYLEADNAIRINCGGKEEDSVEGSFWGADRFFLGGRAVDRYRGRADTAEFQPVYRTLRSFSAREGQPFAYRIPVLPGNYHVTLHFPRHYLQKGKTRLMEILVNDRLRYENLEVPNSEERGGASKRLEVSVDDAFLGIGFQSLLGYTLLAAIEIQRIE